jgi:hypothetical protein
MPESKEEAFNNFVVEISEASLGPQLHQSNPINFHARTFVSEMPFSEQNKNEFKRILSIIKRTNLKYVLLN